MRPHFTRPLSALLIAASTAVGGCSSEETSANEVRYSATDLEQGVSVGVDDPAGAVDSASVFLPDSLPSYSTLQPELASQGVVVMDPGEGGYDVVVVYRAGPFCGLLPTVSISGDTEQLMVGITSLAEGVCETMEYDEAIGLDLSEAFQQAEVSGTHDG